MKRIIIACAVLSFICTNPLFASAVEFTFADSFTGGINLAYWGIASPTSTVGINDRVEVTLGSIYPSGDGLSFQQIVPGNFEATVDFFLLNWDPIVSGGVRVGLGVSYVGSVERVGDPSLGGNVYLADFSTMGGHIDGITPALTYSGSLKVIRFADHVSGYYMDSTTNGEWVLLSEQFKAYADPVWMSFGIWGHTTSVIGRKVAFDNFSLTHPLTNPVPEPSTMLLLGSGLLGLVGYGRRRMKK